MEHIITMLQLVQHVILLVKHVQQLAAAVVPHANQHKTEFNQEVLVLAQQALMIFKVQAILVLQIIHHVIIVVILVMVHLIIIV